MKTTLFSVLMILTAQVASADPLVCKTTKFGLNNSDEVCAVLTPGKHNTLVRLQTDVATYDPVNPSGSRQSIASQICKLFELGPNVFLSMSFRKSEQAGFIGGGAILGDGHKKISTIDTIRCKNAK